jgi:hypothetical protein
MKSICYLAATAAIVGMVSGCASPMPMGALYTQLKLPVAVTSNGVGKKEGVAECKSILALVATGDCSIEAAKKNGGITKVTNVDWEAESVLGIIGNYKLRVYGE